MWNTYEIGVHGRHVEVWLNGVKLNDYTSSRDIALGHIGVQNDGDVAHISYRNIRIRQDAAATDLARGKPVTVSSVEPNSPHVGANAVDGNPATRWGSAYSDPQQITVDLGASVPLRRVRLNWETAFARAYQIQTSTDNTTWQTAFSTTTGDGGIDDIPIQATGRYIRMTGTQRATQWGYSLWELAVFGS
jgi:hypothetical protein